MSAPSVPPGWLKSQFTTLPYPTKRSIGQTIIVTGSNIGMGLEAARHFVRLDASKVILAVRTLSKGEVAKMSIEGTEKRLGVLEVWQLDLESYNSVQAFAAKAQKLERLDVAILNAGIYTFDFAMAEDNERTLTVNVISTFLLSLLLLPKLRETAVKESKETVLTITGSFTHYSTTFPERKSKHILQDLAVRENARMEDRYRVSKLIQLLLVRALSSALTASTAPGSSSILVSNINPGFVDTAIMRETSGFAKKLWLRILKLAFSRTAEVGGRTLVSAAEGGKETHGQYLDDCKVGKPSDFVTSTEGKEVQEQLWKELGQWLERIQPGIMQNI